ncbi:DUF1254 domain-containing protein [Polyangium mundeleinium]|uniref:DUF1254 domain-containing protein n=1 Tax=Polyangium mundeleinium TaxID=2995306 RepID=A0ABT5F864_9BACT|nr:DUF1254 domain-containing protein [Polyangium mundeleinium]MDC0749305.1 DUF1254 domain-containing protein [Polyangium mundeleinium]
MATNADLNFDTAYEIGSEGYTYLYPLVLMDVTRRQMTNTKEIDLATWRAPANVFMNNPRFPGPADRTVVRPNFDTLYSSAWLDLVREPLVIKVPASGGRYYLLPMLDMWTDVFTCPGPRTTGTAAQQLVIVGPGWKGTINPALNLQRIDASTPYVWIIGRTQCNGESDYASVHEFQNGLQIIPLSAYEAGRPPPPPVGSDGDDISLEEPLVVVEKMTPETFFAYGADLMRRIPAHFNDYPILARLARAGFVAGQPFDLNAAPAVVQDAFKRAAPDALAQMKAKQVSLTPLTNGWVYPNEMMGTYGTSYLRRAIIALIGLGANLPEDAIYPTAYVDSTSTALDSAMPYTLRFEADKLPPVNAFWSVTLYDEQGYQVPNAIDRFSLGTRNNLAKGPDGSVTLYVQRSMDEADPRRSNWLPAPQQGAFNLTMRLYSPKRAAINADWHPPAVSRAT